MAKKKGHDCKGRIYRARVNAFIRPNGEYVYQQRMSLMKSLSCPGCKHCGGLDELLNEELYGGKPPVIDNIRGQAFYQLMVTNVSIDYESGLCDDYDLEFVSVNLDNEGGKDV